MYARETDIKLAESKGWEHTKCPKKGSSFERGNTHIWSCRNGWQCADLIDNQFKNHRGLHRVASLTELLEREGDKP